VKGTSSTSPSDPTCEEGNILEGELVDDFPLYRVRLDGLNIEGVDCLFEAIPSLEVVNAQGDAAAEQAEANATDIEGLKGKCNGYDSRLSQMYSSFNVAHISTGDKKTVTIKFKSSSSFAFLFGRYSTNAVVCASIAYSEVKNLGSAGTFTANNGTITMTLGNYAMGFLLHNGNIESITYS
jgi:hypothetical protein